MPYGYRRRSYGKRTYGRRRNTYRSKKRTRFRRTARRTKTKRKFKRRRYVSQVPKFLGLRIPQIMRTKVRYTDSQQAGPWVMTGISVGSPKTYVYSGNGCFDPNITGTGSQPASFDDLSIYYRRYRVLGSKMTVRFSPIQEDDSIPDWTEDAQVPGAFVTNHGRKLLNPTIVELRCDKDTFAASSGLYKRLIENRQDDKNLVMGEKTWGIMYTDQTRPTTLSRYVSTAKVDGFKGDMRSDIGFEGLTGNSGTGSNPDRQWYWKLNAGAFGPHGNVARNVTFTVNIVYYCEFFDTFNITAS